MLCCGGLLFFGCLSGRLRGVSLLAGPRLICVNGGLESVSRAGCLEKKYLGYVPHDHRGAYRLQCRFFFLTLIVLSLLLYSFFSLYSLCFKLPCMVSAVFLILVHQEVCQWSVLPQSTSVALLL